MGRHAAWALLLAGCAGGPAPAFTVDQEEGVHGDVSVEWWYHFGWLSDARGADWAVFSSFFRYRAPGAPFQRYALSDLIDLRSGEGHYRSRLGSEAIPLYLLQTGGRRLSAPHEAIPGPIAEKPGDPLKLAYGEDAFERVSPGTYRLKAGDVNLVLRQDSSPMFVEGTGLTGVDRPEEMHYYTIPRLQARGTVRGQDARGTFWYDHQWGTSWIGADNGWSWWGLQLGDGSAVNAYVLRDVKKRMIRKAVLTHDRRVYPLEATAREWWVSSRGIRYPVSWRLKGGPLDLTIEPLFLERECPLIGEQDTIWEGPVRVSGSHSGRGFQELVKYAREK
jgi:predicted secreted hydrolase